jgi:hypothetical protein
MKYPLLCAALTLVAMPLLAADPPPQPGDDGSNVRFTLTIVNSGPGREASERSVHALALDGRTTRLLTGWRLPIPTTTFNTSTSVGSDVVPVTSYQYQDVGVAVRLEGRIVAERRIRVRGKAEVSSVEDASPSPTPPSTPSIGTFDHEFEIILDDGVESKLVEVPRPDGGSIGLRLAAEIDDRHR